jgi:hypothetical protein
VEVEVVGAVVVVWEQVRPSLFQPESQGVVLMAIENEIFHLG